MAKISDIIEGLQIFLKYNGAGAHLGGADHDVIYPPSLGDKKLSSEDRRRLVELGWHREEIAREVNESDNYEEARMRLHLIEGEDEIWARYC